ncbi:MAG: hypothetical protein NC231_01690 [Bacillus sp. (in: Bacteria)]|nr:hypothetical protein [Bacillus sp. (in: firmicutes)]MCM1425026.1 hypothetical protein [Eubacterium sp.]
MDKKKKIIILAAVILALIVAGGIGAAMFLRGQDDKYVKSAAESDISRYEWMEMLCEQEGITEYQKTEPYYTDVSAGNSYFAYIQSAVEWDVLEEEKQFEGDGYASGRFVLLTAMKSLGERKLKLYLDTKDAITDAVYLQTALEHDLLAEEELSQGISKETAERVLEKLAGLKYTEFWVDDYEKAVYQDGVVEIAPEDILEKKEDGLEITVSDAIFSDISEGTIIVYQPDRTGLKAAKRVSKVEAGGKLTLVDNVKPEEVLESLVVSDIVQLTAQDIFNYYGMQAEYSAGNMAYRQGSVGNMMPVWEASREIEDKGFKIEVYVEEGEDGEENYLEIKATDNNTGDALEVPTGQHVSWESGCKAELNVSQIYAAVHVEFDPILDLQYAEAALDIQSTFSGVIKADEAKEIGRVVLLETSAPLGGGICGVDVLVYLVVSAEGEISLEAELPANFCVKYDEQGGIRRDRSGQKEKTVKLDVDCEADFMLRVEPVLTCLFGDVMDMELDFGLELALKENMRPTGMVCLDLSADFPVLSILVCGDDKKDTFVGDKLGISKEWELISSEDAPLHKNAHIEIADGIREIVAECTYDESKKDDDGTEPQQENGSANTYVTQFGNTKFAFDYPDGWTVNMEESESLASGFREALVLENDRDIMLQYWEQLDNYRLGGQGSAALAVIELTKAADSAIEDFIVGKIQITGSVDKFTGEEYDIEDGSVYYTVIPESYIGSRYAGIYLVDDVSFQYHDSTYMLLVSAPDGQFTEEEETEVIAILQSFREVKE